MTMNESSGIYDIPLNNWNGKGKELILKDMMGKKLVPNHKKKKISWSSKRKAEFSFCHAVF